MNTYPIYAPLLVTLLAAPAYAQTQRAQTQQDGVMYPLPPVPVPDALPSDYVDTEDSPALEIGKAWLKLGQAQKHERSSDTEAAYARWQRTRKRSGPTSNRALKARAEFLTKYSQDLKRAIGVYEEIQNSVGGLDPEAASAATAEADEELAEIEQLQTRIDAEQALNDAACFVHPESCMAPDPTDRELGDEIGQLVGLLNEPASSEGSGLSTKSLLRRTSLLKRRAQLVVRLNQRAAQQIMTQIVTPRDASGRPKALRLPTETRARRPASRYRPADPYR